MPTIAILKFGEMALRRKGTAGQQFVRFIISLALRLFFRRIETYDAVRVPMDEPLLFVLNHPNGLIDPSLVFCTLPRRISFLAKSTLFEMPVLGSLLRLVEALPLYRRVDAPDAEGALNQRTFARCRELFRCGRCIAIFPEGRSHNEPHLQPIKTGAARIALGALSVVNEQLEDSRRQQGHEGHMASGGHELRSLKIVPAGLYYTSKTSFRSEALIRFGDPIQVLPVMLDEKGEPPTEAVHELSALIETALREVTLNVADDEELETVTRAEQLFSSIYETINFRLPLHAEFELRRRFAQTLAREPTKEPRRIELLRQRLGKYESELGGFGIVPENLAVLAHSRSYVLRHFIIQWLAIALVSPLTIFGALLHLPAYLVATFVSRRFRRHGIDEIAPTVKIIAMIILVPLTWLIFALVTYFWLGWRCALAALPFAIFCGFVAVRSFEKLYDLRGWFRASLVLARSRGRFLRLLLERRALQREMRALADDVIG